MSHRERLQQEIEEELVDGAGSDGASVGTEVTEVSEYGELVARCWNQTPGLRPTMHEVMQKLQAMFPEIDVAGEADLRYFCVGQSREINNLVLF